jgi:hypothetical protein
MFQWIMRCQVWNKHTRLQVFFFLFWFLFSSLFSLSCIFVRLYVRTCRIPRFPRLYLCFSLYIPVLFMQFYIAFCIHMLCHSSDLGCHLVRLPLFRVCGMYTTRLNFHHSQWLGLLLPFTRLPLFRVCGHVGDPFELSHPLYSSRIFINRMFKTYSQV